MNCTEVAQHLDAWLDQALDPELAGMVEAHVSQCAACRAESERWQALRAVLRSSEIHQPPAALEERAMGAFHEHHQRPTAAQGWQRLIFGSVSFPKPALAFAGVIVVAALIVTFGLGRMTAPRVMLNSPLQAAAVPSSPTIVEVPVERIVYVKVPGPRGKTSWPRPASTELTAPSPAAPSSAPPSEIQKTGAGIASLDDFEPIKGTTARVIRGSKQR